MKRSYRIDVTEVETEQEPNWGPAIVVLLVLAGLCAAAYLIYRFWPIILVGAGASAIGYFCVRGRKWTLLLANIILASVVIGALVLIPQYQHEATAKARATQIQRDVERRDAANQEILKRLTDTDHPMVVGMPIIQDYIVNNGSMVAVPIALKASDIVKGSIEYNYSRSVPLRVSILDPLNRAVQEPDQFLPPWSFVFSSQLSGMYLLSIKNLSGGDTAFFKVTYTVFSPALVAPQTLTQIQPILPIGGSTRYEYYAIGDNDYSGFGSNMWRYQSFTPSIPHYVTGVNLKLFRVGSPGTITVSVKATSNSGLPTGPSLAVGKFDGNTLTTSENGEWRTIMMDSSVLLASSNSYAVVIEAATSDAGAKGAWRMLHYPTSNYSKYLRGSGGWTSDRGTSWTADSTFSYMFEEWGHP